MPQRQFQPQSRRRTPTYDLHSATIQVSDLAILSMAGAGGEMEGKHAADFDKLINSLTSLPFRTAPLPLQTPTPAQVFTSRGDWIAADATLWNPRGSSFTFSSDVPGGTSGAPVFDDAGLIVGVVSTSGEVASATAVYLLNALPGWMLREGGFFN
jgi:hypothetical protein